MSYAVLVAGGTAGHINAALALGEFLNNKNYEIKFITGTRYLDKKLFANKETLYLQGQPLRTKNPITLVKNLFKNTSVFIGLLFNFIKKRPDFVIGAGGYVCGPSLLAAWTLRIPVFIVEQNACAGLTNKILSYLSKIIFTHFKDTKGLEKFSHKIMVSGNPTRSNIQKIEYTKQNNNKVNLLVFGGSLGAKQINDAIFELLNEFNGHELCVLHQVGKDNLHEVKTKNNISYEQVEYIDDMQKAYEWCDIIISRSGASTISELRVVGRPSILIPYPAATDNHQYYNACELQNEKNFYVNILDHKLNGKELAEKIMTAVNTIIQEDLFGHTDSLAVDSSKIIIDEIEKDVWNK